MKFPTERAVPTIAALVAGAAIIGGTMLLVYSGSPPNKPTAPTLTSEVGRQLDALLRGWVVTDVCYDSTTKSFLLKVYDHEPVPGRLDGGWYMTQSHEFKQLENGSYILIGASFSSKISPDVTGLQCKSQPVNPDWDGMKPPTQ